MNGILRRKPTCRHFGTSPYAHNKQSLIHFTPNCSKWYSIKLEYSSLLTQTEQQLAPIESNYLDFQHLTYHMTISKMNTKQVKQRPPTRPHQ